MEQKYIHEYWLCEKCFLDLVTQINNGNRFKIKPIAKGEEADFWTRDSCDCECNCFEDCDCSECAENGCEQDCTCECKCSLTCRCILGQMHTVKCGHLPVCIRISELNARIFSDNTTALIGVNSVRKQIIDFAKNLEDKKKKAPKGKVRTLYINYFL